MRICLVLDSENRRFDHHREIQSLVREKYEIPLILIDDTFEVDDREDKSALVKLLIFLKNLLTGNFLVLVFLERMIAGILKPDRTVTGELSKFRKRRNVFETIPELNESKVVRFEPVKSGKIKYDFPDNVIDEIRKTCDVVVLMGFTRILTGKSLTAAKYGVLSYHGADLRKYRGRPAAFFEWINDEKEIGMTLQQLTDRLDAGKIIVCKHADISDAKSWEEVRLKSVLLRENLLVEGLDIISQNSNDDFEEPETSELSYYSDANKLINVYKCLKKNITYTYFK